MAAFLIPRQRDKDSNILKARDSLRIMKGGSKYLVTLALLAFACSLASAHDPSPLQDFCVATKGPASAAIVNGKVCKDPKLVTADDFFFSGLNVPKSSASKLGANITLLTADKIPGLNTLGLSFARVDYAPGGLNPPHTHPRATEIQVVLEGTLYVGFVTSNPENGFVTKVLHAGDVFVFPVGLVHFQFNAGSTNAVALSGLSSQNPGRVDVATDVFGCSPSINPDVLTKAFQLDKIVVNYLQKQSWWNNL